MENVLSKTTSGSLELSEWLDEYEKILMARKYKPKTLQNKFSIIALMRRELGRKNIKKVTPKDLDNFIGLYAARDKMCAAKSAFILSRDIFREAWLAGWVQYSSAIPLRAPKNPVKRARLVLNEWLKIRKLSCVICRPYMPLALDLALVTGQRRGDIAKMRRSDIFDDHLHVVQEKTGFRLALPLDLYCAAINKTLRQVINACPGDDYLLSPKRKVNVFSLSVGFKLARDAAFANPAERWKSPPTFHEQRSLSERLYREQGIDTQRLLGHKSRFMTDKYNDDRGREWKCLVL
ncbi:tyrosine-type recombinase/integrase [Salmonella enterica]|nr:tyrosine-type recombinase/integrase [Salmonella enterica]